MRTRVVEYVPSLQIAVTLGGMPCQGSLGFGVFCGSTFGGFCVFAGNVFAGGRFAGGCGLGVPQSILFDEIQSSFPSIETFSHLKEWPLFLKKPIRVTFEPGDAAAAVVVASASQSFVSQSR